MKQVIMDGTEESWEWRIKWGEGHVWNTGAAKTKGLLEGYKETCYNRHFLKYINR